MTLEFELTRRSYSIQVPMEKFTDLLDSECYVTNNAAFDEGNSSLIEKLNGITGVWMIDYSGHYGNYVFLAIDVEDDTPDTRRLISATINEHLKWCASLKRYTRDR